MSYCISCGMYHHLVGTNVIIKPTSVKGYIVDFKKEKQENGKYLRLYAVRLYRIPKRGTPNVIWMTEDRFSLVW